jgi:hypothetical protein
VGLLGFCLRQKSSAPRCLGPASIRWGGGGQSVDIVRLEEAGVVITSKGNAAQLIKVKANKAVTWRHR